MNDYIIALEREHLLKIGFKTTDDCLVFEYTNKYNTIYRMIYEGYAWVLYQLHGVEAVCIQDFRDKDEFTLFFKTLSRNSLSDYHE